MEKQTSKKQHISRTVVYIKELITIYFNKQKKFFVATRTEGRTKGSSLRTVTIKAEIHASSLLDIDTG